MNKFIKSLLSIYIFLTLCICVSNAQTVKFPLQKGLINDYEGLFTPQQQKELSLLISEFEKKTNREISIITLNDIKPYSNLRDYSVDLSYNWSLGKDDRINELLIIVSKSLRTVRITTAYGTEKLIRDDVCKKIINNEMLPAYTSGNYFAGTKQGLLSIMQEWN